MTASSLAIRKVAMILKTYYPQIKTLLLLLILLIAAFSICAATTPESVQNIVEPNNTHSIPIMRINSIDSTLNDITDKSVVSQNNSIIINEDSNSYSFNHVEIKGRGNTTWIDQPKKPYQLKFQNKVNLFNMGMAHNYILLSNAFDYTHMRNEIAFYLEHLLQQDYALKGEFVELYIDDSYRGLYYITQKIEINEARLNLRKPTGIIVELENMRPHEVTCFRTISNTCLNIKDVVNQSQAYSAMQDFLNSYNLFEAAIEEKDYETISNIIDIDSFAKYYLLSEFTVNPDAYATSFFFYKDGPDDKIHVGPGWDFDLAFSNHNWFTEDDSFYSPYSHQAIKNIITNSEQNTTAYSTIVLELTEIPEFYIRVAEIYNSTLSGHKPDLINYIKKTIDYISPIATKDSLLWNTGDFNTNSIKLIDWISQRYDYFEQKFN